MGDSRITCKICKLKFLSYKKLVTHLQEIHNFSSYKEYYDKYFLEKNEDLKCPFCDKERAFDITYYKKYRDTCRDKECIKKAKNRVWKDPKKKEKFLFNCSLECYRKNNGWEYRSEDNIKWILYDKIKLLIIIIFVLMPVLGITGYLKAGFEVKKILNNLDFQ